MAPLPPATHPSSAQGRWRAYRFPPIAAGRADARSACVLAHKRSRVSPRSVFDLDGDALVRLADLERRLAPKWWRQYLARVVGDAVALRRRSGNVGVELPVVVLVMIGGHRVSTRRQVVDGETDRPLLRLDAECRENLLGLREAALAGKNAGRDRAVGVSRSVDRNGKLGRARRCQ